MGQGPAGQDGRGYRAWAYGRIEGRKEGPWVAGAKGRFQNYDGGLAIWAETTCPHLPESVHAARIPPWPSVFTLQGETATATGGLLL